jgi:hypothetical protein
MTGPDNLRFAREKAERFASDRMKKYVSILAKLLKTD